MSGSDDSDDEKMKMMMEAVDTGFLSNKLYDETPKNTEESAKPEQPPPPPSKSQRYLTIEDEVHATDLQIPETMQKFIAQKLSEIIEKNYKFVDMSSAQSSIKHKRPKNRVLLLQGFDTPILYLSELEVPPTDAIQKRPRPVIKRRQIEEEDNPNEADRLQEASVDSEWIESGREVKAWTEQMPSDKKLFRYKSGKDGTLHFVETENEFYKMRKKNCWSEKKIARKISKSGRMTS